MLYHSARISLNRPFLLVKPTPSSPESNQLFEISRSICRSSADTITSILQRFMAQYGLEHAPIIFVLGAVMALNVTVALAKKKNPSSTTSPSSDTPLISDTNLLALDSALEVMSRTWTLAADARAKFAFATRPRAVPVSSISKGGNQDWLQPFSGHQLGEERVPSLDSTATIPQLNEVDFGSSNYLDGDIGNLDPYYWDPLGISDVDLIDWLGG